MRGLFFCLCVFNCVVAVAQSPGGTAPPGGGGGGVVQPTPPPSTRTNWWKKQTTRLQLTRNYDCSNRVRDWEGLKEVRPEGVKETEGDTRVNHIGEVYVSYWDWDSDDESAGSINSTTKVGQLAVSTAAEVDDYWNFGTSNLSMRAETTFDVAQRWFWDGDAQHPVKPTTFEADGHLRVQLSVTGVAEADNESVAGATSGFMHNSRVSAPFNWQYGNATPAKIEGMARTHSNGTKISRIIAFGSRIGIYGAIIELDQADQDGDDNNNSFTHTAAYQHGRTQTIKGIAGGINYSWSGTVSASSTAYSDGATANAASSTSMDHRMAVEPVPDTVDPAP
jgi:hypothetical protein